MANHYSLMNSSPHQRKSESRLFEQNTRASVTIQKHFDGFDQVQSQSKTKVELEEGERYTQQNLNIRDRQVPPKSSNNKSCQTQVLRGSHQGRNTPQSLQCLSPEKSS